MNRRKKLLYGRIVLIVLLAILVIFFNQCGSSRETNTDNIIPSGTLEVHFINVGQGDAILIEENDADMLIDAGNNEWGNDVTEYLKSQNIKELDYIIGTHPHSDHIGGMDTVLNAISADRVILPDVEYKTKTFGDVLDIIESKDIPVTEAKAGNQYRLGDATFTIVAPISSSYEDLNNYSICIKLNFGNTSFLLTGDAEDISEDEMMNSGVDLSADVLKLGHHGSAYSSCDDFLDAVNPDYGVISVGSDNDYGHPHTRTLKSMLTHDINVYRTDQQGTIVFTTDGNNISVNTNAYEITKNDLKD